MWKMNVMHHPTVTRRLIEEEANLGSILGLNMFCFSLVVTKIRLFSHWCVCRQVCYGDNSFAGGKESNREEPVRWEANNSRATDKDDAGKDRVQDPHTLGPEPRVTFWRMCTCLLFFFFLFYQKLDGTADRILSLVLSRCSNWLWGNIKPERK